MKAEYAFDPVPEPLDMRPAPARRPGFRLLLLAALFALAGCVSVPRQQQAQGAFVERTLQLDGVDHRYQVFVPASAASGRTPPVILFLHGSGERGDDGDKPTRVGIGPYIRAHQDSFPAIVVFPQAPENTEWSDNAKLVFAALDAASREFHGDPRRTYLTGLSMGGYGTWDIALRQPGRFAALAPVCGAVMAPREERGTLYVTQVATETDPYGAIAHRLRDMPIWIFHGAKDDLVPPDDDRRLVAAFRAIGATNLRYTEFPDANHNSWDPAYSQTPEFWTWLFAQSR